MFARKRHQIQSSNKSCLPKNKNCHPNYKTFLQHLRQDDRTNTTRPSSYHSTTLGSSSSLPGIITNVSTPLITSSRDGQSDALLLSRQSNRSVPQLVQHVRCKVLQHRVRLQEFFRDDDPLHRGVVTRSQFYRGLSSTKLRG